MTEEIPGDEGLLSVPPLSSPFLEELIRDESCAITYSYYSTVSTNYTASNLVGAGRVLGNLFSRAGFSLEKFLEKLARRTSSGREVELSVALQWFLFTDNWVQNGSVKNLEKDCKTLLLAAESMDVDLQVTAFLIIVQSSIWCPIKILSVFKAIFRKRGEISDVAVFSWKRSGVEYSVKWLFWYKLVLRFLSTQSSPVVEAAGKLNDFGSTTLDFSVFERLLLCCVDVTDSLLAYHFIYYRWNGEGLQAYLSKNGFSDPALLVFVRGCLIQWDLYLSHIVKWPLVILHSKEGSSKF
ncbi:hypothetical protein SCHPADRAFT_939620 [Schizopora paradoxa]|uniref:Uncharacterized protein n=1 Tax=Schizopora paradoxa TaxID=27342 RepID=A0A0H2RRU1_9AGAM|nr:hypothetical protein SCHPADRAFT_939620 [Schizopora paradoxa]